MAARIPSVLISWALSSLIVACASGLRVGVEGDEAAFHGLFLTPTGTPPPSRVGHSAVYDTDSYRMTVFGGVNASEPLNDVWVLTHAVGATGSLRWIHLVPAGVPPEPRNGHSAVYDSRTSHMTVFGGADVRKGHVFDDLWILLDGDGAAGAPVWARIDPGGESPGARTDHTAVYDPASNRMILYGGTDLRGGALDGVWLLTNCNGVGARPGWLSLETKGDPPPALQKHSAVYDPGTNRMIVFGGFSLDHGTTNDVWVLTNANGMSGEARWTKLSPAGEVPLPRERHSAVFDPATNRMTVFGGFEGAKATNDVWVLVGANGLLGEPMWIRIVASGRAPERRGAHSAIYSPQANRMTVYSGSSHPGGVEFSDLWVLTRANGSL